MNERYAPGEIESKWQRRWADARVAYVDTAVPGDEYYMLNMYPYPSGSRLHVGHGRNYILGDALYRRQRMAGRKALNPMGWDAFGLPGRERRDPERRPAPRVHAGQHRPHEGAALRPGLPLRLVQGAGLLRAVVLPLEPVAVSEDVGARARVPQDRSRELVPGLPDRAGQRTGRRRALRALRRSRRDPRSHPVVLPRDRLRRAPARRSGPAPALVRAREDDAAQLDRALGGRGDPLPGRRPHRAGEGLHDAPRHALRRDVPGAGSRASGGREARGVFAAATGNRGVRRKSPEGVAPGPGSRGRREGGAGHGRDGAEPGDGRADPRAARQLRPSGLRHGGDHGRSRPRPARLRVRAQVWPADPPGLPDRRGRRGPCHA